MKKLLSLPPNLVECFHDITNTSHEEWFCTNDPIGSKLGSGGGTTWAVNQARNSGFIAEGERCIILHAGGQSRRLPSYAPSGKILTPIPVFRWKRGQKLSQNLLDLQLPLYQQIIEKAPLCLTTMIVSGDVYIRANDFRVGFLTQNGNNILLTLTHRNYAGMSVKPETLHGASRARFYFEDLKERRGYQREALRGSCANPFFMLDEMPADWN